MPTNTLKNAVAHGITSVAGGGTGTITLAAAASGFIALTSADDGLYFPCTFIEGALGAAGTAKETANLCLFTWGGTIATSTLTRGTFESSTTGTAITLTSAGTVIITPTAASLRPAPGAPLLLMGA